MDQLSAGSSHPDIDTELDMDTADTAVESWGVLGLTPAVLHGFDVHASQAKRLLCGTRLRNALKVLPRFVQARLRVFVPMLRSGSGQASDPLHLSLHQ